ncbi:NADH-ubiquinone reductase complex 1 MLRQ subunit [Nitzschia inconspicua]|uniref:NADH-ubiquinone reductase complex 1 MLRQ subunit n=1 Tax=Nitzschia inconspicua TaxID=303405 RepID=A0A9K3KPX9_9STRA|nr:NADH-ubiquinone reductase complex 1 MLRQ subunit [Nitzschia inconspicua]
MNAFARSSFNAVPRVVGRRNFSAHAVADKIKSKPVWLNDPSTYPVIGITAVACVGCFAYVAYIQTCKEYIQWDKNKRGSVIRWWGDDKAQARLAKA